MGEITVTDDLNFFPEYEKCLAIWAYSLICRLDNDCKVVENLYPIPKSPLREEVSDKYPKSK